MLLSRRNGLLFIHIQKTGGSSVARVLRREISGLEPFLGTHDHALWARQALGAEYGGLFSFAFVRNPWDRLVSWYTMIQERREKWRPEELNRLWRYALRCSNSFEEFVRDCTDVVHDTDGVKSFAFNQLDYLTDEDGTLIVDFVGRYERLNQDAEALFSRIGVPGARLPHANPSSHRHYSSYYSEEARHIVAERFARDIEYFGYAFESPASETEAVQATPKDWEA
jgi:hypothetical protein